ncbi:MAG: helix-turn-helix transcriptional regulator [Myxococcaceae bacterium]|nr:helix-turn-helix transcriptional regulator [Myxococcaceae bacterium]
MGSRRAGDPKVKADPLQVIEAAYAIDRPLDTWLGGVLEGVEACLGEGLGVWSVLYDARDATQLRFQKLAQRGLDPQHAALISGAASSVAPSQVKKTFVFGACGTLSESLGRTWSKGNAVARQIGAGFGVGDALGINATDPTLRGCMLAVPLRRRKSTSRAFKARWSRVAAHVAAGHRLLRQLDATSQRVLDGAEAILDPDGTLQHAERAAQRPAARAALRGAAVALDRLRTRAVRARDADTSIELWKGLVGGRWSLVEHFERDGRRLLIARRNDPQVGGGLTLRELQVAGFAALGHSNKLISYELGLTESTVATHLMRAARHLKLPSRAALVRHLRSNLSR